MKVLTLDIETSPNLAYVWGLWDQNINLAMLQSSVEVLCWAAKWLGEDEVMFDRKGKRNPKRMVRRMWHLLDDADVVVHYNGKQFDMPHLNREFALLDLGPPSPYKQVDLLHVVRKQFRFPSNKLEYVGPALGCGEKAPTGGFETWKGCMTDDPESWARMQDYNEQDVLLTERLYLKVLPWINGHPNRRLFDGDHNQCPTCGSSHLQRRGYAYTAVSEYVKMQCQACGSYFRSGSRLRGVKLQEAVR